jgi:hypothetical protein
MEELVSHLTDSDRQIHWIWFREKGFQLPNKIMSRARSWLVLNPEFKFNLWTNLQDSLELEDFIASLSADNRSYFTGSNPRICVKYISDIQEQIEEFCLRFASQLKPEAHEILQNWYQLPHTATTTTTTKTLTQEVKITTIKTETTIQYKINRIFKVDTLRIIILSLLGGIYCDFNDTICFYPMKYLLTLYRDQYFMGTDYDTEHPIYRNNYFIYTSLGNKAFQELTLKCVNKAVGEYTRITTPSFCRQYVDLAIELLMILNTKPTPLREGFPIITEALQLPLLKEIIARDPIKDTTRVMKLVGEIIEYLKPMSPTMETLGKRLSQEIDQLDPNQLRSYIIRKRCGRRRYPSLPEIVVPIAFNREEIIPLVTTFEFYDHFLMKYAILMTIGDLILSTNIAYIDEIPNLIPYSRSNRLSTISMLTHIYDGTSYGLTKVYQDLPTSPVESAISLRQEFL